MTVFTFIYRVYSESGRGQKLEPVAVALRDSELVNPIVVEEVIDLTIKQDMSSLHLQAD